MARFSIILPVRNGGEYVKLCVKSILSQTVPDFNLEVLDNYSTDGTLQWVESLQDDRIRCHPSQKPLTIEDNWGRITAIPKNEFMSFIGHDDLLDSNYLAVMDQLIKKYPAAGFYQSHFRYINADGDTIRSCKPMDEVQQQAEFLAFFLKNMSELSIGQVIRSSDYDLLGGIPAYPNLLFADLELWIKLLLKGPRVSSSLECCSYRIHARSTTNSSAEVKYYFAFLKLLDFFVTLHSMNEKFETVFAKYGLDFLELYCRSLSHHILRIPKSERKDISVAGFLSRYKQVIDILVPGNHYLPESLFSIKLAKQIDGNALSRTLFLAFKKVYSKPVLG